MKTNKCSPCAELSVRIDTFRPLGCVMPISSSTELLDGGPYPGLVRVDQSKIIIDWSKAERDVDIVRLCFRPIKELAPKGGGHAKSGVIGYGVDPGYLFVGVAFSGKSGKYMGQNAFPRILIETVSSSFSMGPVLVPDESVECESNVGLMAVSRQLTIYVKRDPSLSRIIYDYVMLVQDVKTGEVGIIDPSIESEAAE